MRLADRIVVLGGGAVLQSDAPEQIYRQPNSIAVALAIGTPPANLIPMSALRSISVETAASLMATLRDCPASATLVVRPDAIRISAEQTDTPHMVAIHDDDLCFGGTIVSSRFVSGRWLTRLVVQVSEASQLSLLTLSGTSIRSGGATAQISLSDLVWVAE